MSLISAFRLWTGNHCRLRLYDARCANKARVYHRLKGMKYYGGQYAEHPDHA